MNDGQIAVTVTSFGEGRFDARVPMHAATVAAVLESVGVEARGRRLALNGHSAAATVGVVEGDQVTVVPRVQGG